MLPTQEQMYEKSRRENASLIQEVAFMCGMMGHNPNPLTDDEIIEIAQAKKFYSHAFEPIANAIIRRREEASVNTILEAL